jgi:uncharacterized protein
MLYAIILNKIQGHFPAFGGFINKFKAEKSCELTEKIQKSTQEVIDDILKILRGTEPPLKISSVCKETPWFDLLLKEAKAKSDIALIYNVRVDSLEELRKAGVRTISDMALCDLDGLPKIKGASTATLKRAQMQASALISGKIIQVSDPILPDAHIKIYFDIEGDPFLGVQYLFGFLIVKGNDKPIFTYFLAENPSDEGNMWNDFLYWLKKENFSDFKVYHYASYEKTYLGKLSEKYGGSEQLSCFIENLVDLSTIVTQSFIFPIYFYSIKDIAKHLNFKWQHAKAGGAQSIFWYEQWLETGDRAVLQDIINYNEDDVRATEFLHDWLKEN